MAKYSTGGSSRSDDDGTCELCGAPSTSLREATIAGATLFVCRSCAPHDDSGTRSGRTGSDRQDEGVDRGKRAARNAARLGDELRGDPTHWEEHGTNYDDDPLPYLVSGYDDRVRAARREAGLSREELATELDVDESAVLAVEQGRAARAGIGGGLISALEDHLGVALAERS